MTPLQEISAHPGLAAGIRLFVKRDDLLHPEIHGNKWRKLRHIFENGPLPRGIATFGGPFSNHLHAVASAGKIFKVPTVGIVRGTAADLENPTLAHARTCGMALFPVAKNAWDLKEQAPAVAEILARFPGFLLLPEGGSTAEAVRGCMEISEEILFQVAEIQAVAENFGPRKTPGDFLSTCVPAGTGATAAGVSAGFAGRGRTLIFPAAAYGISEESVRRQIFGSGNPPEFFEFQILENRRFKKFARVPPELLAFAQKFEAENGFRLDPIYTSKMFFQVFEMLGNGGFPKNSLVVALHTGGLQGWNAKL